MGVGRDESVTIFALIGDFVQQLSVYFDAKSHIHDDMNLIKLALYERLIEHTGPTNLSAIEKHLSAFKTWVVENKDACLNTDVSLIVSPNITYSDNVYIPMKYLLTKLELAPEQSKIMWKHILNVGFRVTKDIDIKTKLQQLVTQKSDSGSEGVEEHLVEKTIGDIKRELESMDGITNAKDAVVHMAKNGTFERLIDNFASGMEKGNLDMGKMLNVVLQKTGNSNMDMSGLGSIMKMMGAAGNTEQESVMFEEFDTDVGLKKTTKTLTN